eukprot:Awhi_evm1s15697
MNYQDIVIPDDVQYEQTDSNFDSMTLVNGDSCNDDSNCDLEWEQTDSDTFVDSDNLNNNATIVDRDDDNEVVVDVMDYDNNGTVVVEGGDNDEIIIDGDVVDGFDGNDDDNNETVVGEDYD